MTPEQRRKLPPLKDNAPWSKVLLPGAPGLRSDTEVHVKLQQDDVTHVVWLKVSVRSLIRPANWAHLKLNPDSARLEYEVSAAAEVLATHQNLTLKDYHNPSAVAKAAREALKEVQALAQKARRGRGRS